MASNEIRVPELGDFKDVAVIELLVKAGDSVQVDTPLLTLETDKATIDVPSTQAGVIQQLHVSKGSKVSAGSLIATLASPEAATPAGTETATAKPAPPPTAPDSTSATPSSGTQPPPAAPATAPESTSATPSSGTPPLPAAATAASDAEPPAATATASAKDAKPPPQLPAAPTAAPARESAPQGNAPPAKIDEDGFSRAHASPSVRRFARELGVDLGRVKGSGQKARITEEDVKAFVKSLMATAPGGASSAASGLPKVVVPDFAQFGPVEIKPLSRVQKISGPRLHASWVNLPHVTQFDEADITELEKLREQLKPKAEAAGLKLTPLAFIVCACVKALQRYPLFNASLDESGQNLVYKKYVHIGFAADTPNGLLVPVIRDAEHKDIYEVARALGELSAKARSGKLSAAEMQGGSFTISSLGGIGGTAFTPIINAPEVAILGVSRSSQKPVFSGGSFVPRLILPLSLSYDHRVIDGANGARFTNYLATLLADPHSLIEAVL